MQADLIQFGILALVIIALAVRNEHRLTNLEADQRGNVGVDHYLEKRLDKHEERIDKLEE